MPSTDKPGPPAAFDITDMTNDSCLLTWNPPRDDGGSKITNYVGFSPLFFSQVRKQQLELDMEQQTGSK